MRSFVTFVLGFSILFALPGVALAELEGEIIVVIGRADDKVFEAGEFIVLFEATLDTSTSAPFAGATLTIAGGDPLLLERSDDVDEVSFELEEDVPDLAALQSEGNGVWEFTLDMVGVDDVVSNFTVNTAAMTEDDIYPTPVITNPAHGARGVDPNVNFQWTDPTGAADPHVLIVRADNDTNFGGESEENSIEGPLAETDTSWMPGLLPGRHEFEVQYYASGESFVSSIATTSGTVTWNLSGFAPAGYDSSKPLMALGSVSIIAFSVPVVEPFAYPGASDTVGRSVDVGGGSFVQHYYIEDGSDEVASVTGPLAESADVVAAPGDPDTWGLAAAAGSTGSLGSMDGYVLLGRLPAFSDLATAGPFADLFGSNSSSPTPRQLWGVQISVTARETRAEANSQYRVVAEDAGGNQVLTDPISLTNSFTTRTFSHPAFRHSVNPGNFTWDAVASVGIALFTTPGETESFDLQVGEVSLEFLPEPASGGLAFAALAVVAGLARRRRHNR